jgi:hypothetical protein
MFTKYCIIHRRSYKGRDNPNYRGGKSRLPKCTDCGKQLQCLHSIRCNSCTNKYRWKDKNYKEKTGNSITKSLIGKKSLKHSLRMRGENNPAWKGGISRLSKCIDCGSLCSSYKTKRCTKCSKIGINNPMFGVIKFHKGEKNPNWKGGITPLFFKIRGLDEYTEWRTKIFKRDNYTCQECGQHGGVLHAHHKKEFNIILKEFLQLYNQFSPMEDKETLVRLSISYAPFWDIDNGKTLCKKCHSAIKNIKCENRNDRI